MLVIQEDLKQLEIQPVSKPQFLVSFLFLFLFLSHSYLEKKKKTSSNESWDRNWNNMGLFIMGYFTFGNKLFNCCSYWVCFLIIIIILFLILISFVLPSFFLFLFLFFFKKQLMKQKKTRRYWIITTKWNKL